MMVDLLSYYIFDNGYIYPYFYHFYINKNFFITNKKDLELVNESLRFQIL